MSKVFQAYASRKHAPISSMLFLFDGVRLDGGETANSLGLQDQDQIDCVLQTSAAGAMKEDNNENNEQTKKYAGGDQYVGQMQNEKRHGEGTMTYAEGNDTERVEYVGAWKDDQPNGEGTMVWVDGHKYVGAWMDDKKHGQGTLTCADGSKYVGEWKDGKSHGQGTHTWPNGNTYVGVWKNGTFDDTLAPDERDRLERERDAREVKERDDLMMQEKQRREDQKRQQEHAN